jgi:recombination protein RecT
MASEIAVKVKELRTDIEGRRAEYLTIFEQDEKRTDKFISVVLTAFARDPDIALCSPRSVHLECMKAAQDGLTLDGREAALVRISSRKLIDGKWTSVPEVIYIPMIAGVIKRVRNSGEIVSWTCELVYVEELKQEATDGSGKRFRYRAMPPELYHEPIIFGSKGECVGAYSAVKLRDGSFDYCFMNIDQLNETMNRSRSKKRIKLDDGSEREELTGPWKTDRGEMYKKTVMKRHSKRLPVSAELRRIVDRDNDMYDLDPGEWSRDPEPAAQEPKAVASARKKSAAKALKEAAKKKADHNETPHDEETGEILEGEILTDGGYHANVAGEDGGDQPYNPEF